MWCVCVLCVAVRVVCSVVWRVRCNLVLWAACEGGMVLCGVVCGVCSMVVWCIVCCGRRARRYGVVRRVRVVLCCADGSSVATECVL